MIIYIFQVSDYLHPLGLTPFGELLLFLVLIIVLVWRLAVYASHPTFEAPAHHEEQDNSGYHEVQ